MVPKKREVSDVLKKKRFLYLRGDWSEKETRQYLFDEKGFEGELKFDGMVEKFPDEKYSIIEDLLFEVNQSYAQADSILLAERKLILAEIKNYEGDHYYEHNHYYTSTGYELKNPMIQLERTESFLSKLLKSFGCTIPIESYLIFVNPNFTLHQAPRHTPKHILPTQISPFLQKLEATQSKVGLEQMELATKLIGVHQTHNPFHKVPEYSYHSLKKGLYCERCKTFSLDVLEHYFVCRICKHQETVQHGVMRGVDELHVLFPELRINLDVVRDWCRLEISRRQVQYVLGKHLVVTNKGRHSYYRYLEDKK